MPVKPKRILFVAEAVTLAQVVRLVSLARALDPARYEVHFAAARFDELVFGGTDFIRHQIWSLSPATIDGRVARGQRLYGRRTLAAYVREERALLQAVRPRLVVGDLRLSLAVSAPLEQVPYAALINAYWSPHAERDGFPLPEHPIVKLLGVALAERYFGRALPFVFRHFARPVNWLRRRHGLADLGTLPEILTFADHTLFADIPAIVPTRALPAHQRYLGYVPWSPPVPLPDWWTPARSRASDDLRDPRLVGTRAVPAGGARGGCSRSEVRCCWRRPAGSARARCRRTCSRPTTSRVTSPPGAPTW